MNKYAQKSIFNKQSEKNGNLISIIVPVYNGEQYIKTCIESILAQTYENLELIVIDDGSSDQTYDIVFHMSLYDKRIKLFKQKNKGVSSARNLGLINAQGAYIGFVDSDDYIKQDMYEKMIEKISTSDLVICNHLFFNNKEDDSAVCYPQGNYNSEQIIKAIFEHNIGANVWRMLFKKKIIDQYNITFPEIKISEDMLFCFKYLLNIEKICVLSDKCYVYNVSNENSAVRNMGNERYLTDYVQFPFLLTTLFKNNNSYNKYKNYIAGEIVVTAMSIRLMKPFRKFKQICKEDTFRSGLDETAIHGIKDKKYRIYYWGLCKKHFLACNLGYWFNYIKSRL